MAKFRKVHTSFWDDPLIELLNPDARYFYLFLMTNPLCTECGIYEISVKKMCNYTGFNEDSIKSLIRILEIENARIVYDPKTSEICILKKPNYIENTGKPVIDCLKVEFENVKNKRLIERQFPHIEKPNIRVVYASLYAPYENKDDTLAEPDASSKKLGQEENRIEEEKEEKKNTTIRGEVIFNAEEEILKNQIEFERICISTKKNIDEAKLSLRKYHLFLEEKEQYPKTKKAIFAGFEKWLLNENFNNGSATHKSNNSGSSGKPGTSEARIEAIRKW